MTSPDEKPWQQQPRQWAGIAAVALLVALGAVLITELEVTSQLERDNRNAIAQLDAAEKQRQSRTDDIAAMDDLLQKNNDHKEQLIHDIGNFESQLAVLKARTEKLEEAHQALDELEAASKAFRQVQDHFEGDLRELEKITEQDRTAK